MCLNCQNPRWAAVPFALLICFIGAALYPHCIQAAWENPVQVLKVGSKDPLFFIGVDDCEHFYFQRGSGGRVSGGVVAYNKDGTIFREMPAPPMQMIKETNILKGWLGIRSRVLGSCDGVIIWPGVDYPHWVCDQTGKFLRLLEPRGFKYIPLENGDFIEVALHEDPNRNKYYAKDSPQSMRAQRYYLYDATGTFLKELNHPPQEMNVVISQRIAPKPADKWMTIVYFPTFRFTFSLERRFEGHSLIPTVFGWVESESNFKPPDAINKEGTLLGQGPDLLDLFSDVAARLKSDLRRDKCDPCEHNNVEFQKDIQWDYHGNYYREIVCEDIHLIYQLPWVEGPVPMESPRAEVVPLNGFGMPLPSRKCPPFLNVPASVNPGENVTLTYLYPEQDISIDNDLYPVYSLWDYQLSSYQRDNPGAILGSIAAAGINPRQVLAYEIAPWIELDFTKNYQTGLCDMLLWKSRTRFPMRNNGWGFEQDADERKVDQLHKIEFKDTPPDIAKKITSDGRGKLYLHLDPALPEILWMRPAIARPSMETKDLVVFIETGDDTKIFVPPFVMTRLWLKPKDWPSKERTTILAHSRNWHDEGKEDTVRLTETESGSGRFVSTDGTVIYEFRHVMNPEKRKVPATTPDTFNYIYLYITDPAIGLDHAPQLIYENGQDSEEYWSIAEPEWNLINYPFYRPWGYKPWSQVSEETVNARFHVEVSGGNIPANPVLAISWDDPDGKRQRAFVPLSPSGEGKFKTTIPLFAFAPKGCDIGKTWWWSETIPTPQIPGAVTFRDKNVKWEVIGP